MRTHQDAELSIMLYDSDPSLFRILVDQEDKENVVDPTRTVIVYTVASAVSIICNVLLLILISRKKYLEEETKQPTYYRIMRFLVYSCMVINGNYVVAGINGNMRDILTEQEASENNISFGCYMQSFLDLFSYTIYMLGCEWLCVYFLLRLYYGVARISPVTEAFAYTVIVFISLGYHDAVYRNGTVGPNHFYGICSVNSQDISFAGVALFIPLVEGAFLLGILVMFLIIFKTFRDEQEINQRSRLAPTMTNLEVQPHLTETSRTHFEATKDIAMQAFVFVLFLFLSFGVDIYCDALSRIISPLIYMVSYLSKGLYLLVLYLWFEVRIITKHYPTVSKLAALKAIITDNYDVEISTNEEEITEETPLILADSNRCLIDIAIVQHENKEEEDGEEDDLYDQIMQEIEQESSNGVSFTTSQMSKIVNDYVDAVKQYLGAAEHPADRNSTLPTS